MAGVILNNLKICKDMGWKKVKEHYGIKHIVQVDSRRDYGKVPCILIGSPYIGDIIVIRIADAKILKRYDGSRFTNELLFELQPKLDEDEKNGTLKRLIDEQDTFERLLPVYNIQRRRIVKMYCESYGYPNVTTDGQLMYENTFASQLRAARYYLLHRSKMNWRIWWRHVKERLERIVEEIRYFHWELGEIWDCIYVRCWGYFFVKENKIDKT